MKTRLFILTTLFISLISGVETKAQNVGINSTGIAPDNSAMLDVSSTSKGFLLPRMTKAQILAIASPAVGLMVYNLDCNILEYYDGSRWIKVSSSNYVASTSTSQTFNFIGFMQTFTVPACVTSFTLKVWGAGGGGGGWDVNKGGNGGGGAYSTRVISATPGDVLQIWVGGSGNKGTSGTTASGGIGGWGFCNGGNGGTSGSIGGSGSGGGGGGSSAIKNQTTNTVLVVAGGGGGGGGSGAISINGSGGNGGAGAQNGSPGGVGTTGGASGGNGTCVGQVGANRGSTDGGGSGAGGGGYTNGGAAGTVNTSGADYGGGGGGGGNSLGTVTIGSGQTPGNSLDADLCAGCASGGTTTTTTANNGGNGVIKIYWN